MCRYVSWLYNCMIIIVSFKKCLWKRFCVSPCAISVLISWLQTIIFIDLCPTSTRCLSRTWHRKLPFATWDCEQRLSATGEKEGRWRGKPENTQDVVRKLALGTHSSPNSHPDHDWACLAEAKDKPKEDQVDLPEAWAEPCWKSTPFGCCMEPCDPEGGPGHYGPLWHDPCLGLLLKWSVAGKSDQWLMLKVIIVGWCWVNYIDLRTTPP